VAELPAEAVRAAIGLALDEDPRADPHLAEDAEEAAQPAGPAEPVLGERRQVRLVVHLDRQAAQVLRQHRPDR
jgi:hypothetical protein